MIDGLKLQVVNVNYTKFLENKNLIFNKACNMRTFYREGLEAQYKRYLKIVINCYGYVYIYGSLHKAKTNGDNSTNFYYSEIIAEINVLCNCLEVLPTNLKILRTELGLNLRAPPNTFKLLSNSFICINASRFDYMYNKKNTIGIFKNKQQYMFKLYNKTMQMKSDEKHFEIIRYEIRYKSQKLKLAGINTMADLLDKNKFNVLTKMLLQPLKYVVFAGIDIDMNSLKSKEASVYIQGLNANYWEQVKSNASKYNSFKTRYSRIIRLFSKLNLYDEFIEVVNAQWTHLLNN